MAQESTVLMERGEKSKSRTVEGGKMSELKPLNTVRKQNLRKQWRHLEIVVNQIGQRKLRASNPSLPFICSAAQSQYKLLDILVQHLPHQAIIHAKKEAVKRV